jgi:hypothetical protein
MPTDASLSAAPPPLILTLTDSYLKHASNNHGCSIDCRPPQATYFQKKASKVSGLKKRAKVKLSKVCSLKKGQKLS